MFLAQLTELRRTTGFRLGIVFLGLLGALTLGLVAFIYWQTAGYFTARTDDTIARELHALTTESAAERREQITERTAKDLGNQRPIGVFQLPGTYVSGNLRKLPAVPIPIGVPFEFATHDPAYPWTYRAMAAQLDAGHIAISARSVDELQLFSNRLAQQSIVGGLLVLLLGLAGATVAGASSVRRMRGIRSALDKVIAGDLSQRLPESGGAGDVNDLVRVVNISFTETERLVDEVKGVCDSIAHDMRTPLTRLLARLERADRSEHTARDDKSAITDAIQETKSILQTFNALLHISELEDGVRREKFRPVDLATIVRDVAEYHEPLADAKQIELILAPLPQLVPLMSGDADLLFEAMANIIDNAIKFTPHNGRVTIALTGAPAIIVEDTGPGIAPEDRERVLVRFYRSEASRNLPGNGLGLALVAAIARLHRIPLTIEDTSSGCRVRLGFG